MLTPRIKFVWDRHHRSEKRADRTGSIELRISLDGNHRYISTGIAVQKKRWSDREQMVVGIEEAPSYNTILMTLKTSVSRIINGMQEEGVYDLPAIAERLKAPTHKITFLEYVEIRMEKLKHTATANTMKNYRTFLKKMKGWGKINSFSDITQPKIHKMDLWLKERGLKQDTIYDYHKYLRKFINDAVVDGFMKENPYSTKGIKLKRGVPRINNYVTEEEMRTIMNKELVGERLNRVRDLFVFQANTGMAYADLSTFDFAKAKKKNGVYVMDGKRVKTNIPYHFVLLEDAVTVLRKYNWKLPIITNQKYNDYLKLLASACNIDKPISSHWARRTAGMLMLNNGVPMGVVSRILGHASIRTTEKAYAFLLNKTIDHAMIEYERKMKEKM